MIAIGLRDQLRYSIEECIREHITQDVDFDNAIREACDEIVRMLTEPIAEQITIVPRS